MFSFSVINAKAESYSLDEKLAMNRVMSTGVMIGTENGFEGESNLTRAQAAALMVRIKGISEDSVEGERKRGAIKFSDVGTDHWALGYVNVANMYGLVNGVGDGKFDPNAKVKVAELVTMAARVLNAKDMIEAKGTWPDNYMDYAEKTGLLEEVDSTKYEYAKRIEAATVIAKILEEDKWTVVKSDSGKTIGYERADDTSYFDMKKIDVFKGEIVDTLSSSKNTVTFEEYDDDHKSIVPSYKVSDDVKFSDFKAGSRVEVLADHSKDELIMIYPTYDKREDEKEIAFSSITKYEKNSDKISGIINGLNITMNFSEAVSDKEYIGAFNGEKMTLEDIKDELNEAADDGVLGEICGKAVVDDWYIKSINFMKYDRMGVVSSTSSTRINFFDDEDIIGATSPSYIVVSDKTVTVLDEDGKEIDHEDIEEMSAIKYGKGEDDRYFVQVWPDNVMGNITRVLEEDNNKYIYIDGKRYKVADTAEDIKLPAKDYDARIYLNSDNEIVMYTLESDIVYNFDEEEKEKEEALEVKVDCKTGIIVSAEAKVQDRKQVLELGISDLSGNVSTRYVDLERMLRLFPGQFDDKSILQDEIIKYCLGKHVQYTIESSKYVLYQFGSFRYKNVNSDIVYQSSAKLYKTSNKIGSYYYDSNTRFYMTSKYSDSDNEENVSLEEMYLMQFSDNKYYNISVSGTRESKLDSVIIQNTENIESMKGIGIITGTKKLSTSLAEVTILNSFGVKTYKVSTSELSTEDAIYGSLIDYTLIGNVIDECSVTAPKISDKLIEGKVYEIYSGAIKLALPDGTSKYYDTENLIIAKGNKVLNTNGTLTLSSLARNTSGPTKIPDTYKFSSTSGSKVYCYIANDAVVALMYQ